MLVVERKLDLAGAVISSGYALQAEGDFAVSAGSALSLTAEKMRLSYNTLGRALRDALELDPRALGVIPSTKGTL